MSNISTGFKDSTGTDIAGPLVDKSYLIDRYPELVGTFKQAGLWVWGGGAALGTNSSPTSASSPVQTVAGGTNWKLVGGGDYHVAAIKTDGTLWTWGNNNNGQLGNNSITPTSSPVQTISAGTNWKQVAVSSFHIAAIKTDGTLWLWGHNNCGQLGNNNITHRSSPVQTVSGGTNWKLVAAGNYHTAAIKTDGTLWTWGFNNNGELGVNTGAVHRSSPVQTVAGGTNWQLVSCGQNHTAAIKTDGTLWTWGDNSCGRLGDNTVAVKQSPVQTVAGGTNWKQVACGAQQIYAIKTNGELWGWGANNFGQLGVADRTHRSSPVQTISGGTNWKQVSSGGGTITGSSPAAIKTDGTLWVWGWNPSGQLGTNDRVHRSVPVQTVAGGTNWKQVAASQVMLAIRDDSSDAFGNPL